MIAPASPDGRPISEVGPWARDKLTILEQYIKISRHARAKRRSRNGTSRALPGIGRHSAT